MPLNGDVTGGRAARSLLRVASAACDCAESPVCTARISAERSFFIVTRKGLPVSDKGVDAAGALFLDESPDFDASVNGLSASLRCLRSCRVGSGCDDLKDEMDMDGVSKAIRA